MKNEKSKKLYNTILNAIIIALSLFVVVLIIVGLFSLGSSAIAVGTSDNLMYAMYPFEITLGGTDGYYTIDGTPTLNSSMIQDGYTESTSATSGGAISTDAITVIRDRFTYTESDSDADYYFNYDTDAQFTQVRVSGRDWYCRGSIPPVQSIHLPDNVSCNYVITVEVEYWDQDDTVTYTYNGHSGKGTSVTLIRNDEMWTEDIAKDYNYIHIVSYNCLMTLTTSDIEYYQDFTIDGTIYTSPVDTTWSTWCMSDYNTGGFYVNEDDNLVYKSEYERLTYNGNDVSGGTLIVDGGAYTLVDIAVESVFYVGDTQYTFIEGQTWMQWVLTDYNTDHFYLEEDTNTLYTADDKEILYNGNGISGSYQIIANGVYTIAPSGVVISAGTYVGNNSLDFGYGPGAIYYQLLNFSCNGVDYIRFCYGTWADEETDYIYYNTSSLWNSGVLAYDDGWKNTNYKTITISTDQTVTEEFATWFNANYTKQVEDELKGTWVFSSFAEKTITGTWTINFTSNSVNYTSLTLLSTSGNYGEDAIKYGSTVVAEVSAAGIDGDVFAFSNVAYKTITITSNLADVTNGSSLLTWLKSNATKQ